MVVNESRDGILNLYRGCGIIILFASLSPSPINEKIQKFMHP
jgi:hypothetical protein